jgi:hypothetical protein
MATFYVPRMRAYDRQSGSFGDPGVVISVLPTIQNSAEISLTDVRRQNVIKRMLFSLKLSFRATDCSFRELDLWPRSSAFNDGIFATILCSSRHFF